MSLNTSVIDQSWHELINHALPQIDQHYLKSITDNPTWLPGQQYIFNAFSLPLAKTQYILFGESPYPRQQSANGYAFWDAAVDGLWSETGLSKMVNRATSLRNIIKMLLIAEGALNSDDTSQQAIATCEKSYFVQTIDELFQNFLNHGILLLNASLVLSNNSVKQDAKAWQPFMKQLLEDLQYNKPNIQLLLFGKIAEQINHFEVAKQFDQLVAEHPYNISFITNTKVINFFKPLHLLQQQGS